MPDVASAAESIDQPGPILGEMERRNSFDSRHFGAAPRKQIVGQATAVALSFDRQHYGLPRWQRFFTALDR
jgi:type IV secretory pathway protease TraF